MADWRDDLPGWLKAMRPGDPIRVELTGVLEDVGYGQLGFVFADRVSLDITYGADHEHLYLPLHSRNVKITPVYAARPA